MRITQPNTTAKQLSEAQIRANKKNYENRVLGISIQFAPKDHPAFHWLASQGKPSQVARAIIMQAYEMAMTQDNPQVGNNQAY